MAHVRILKNPSSFIRVCYFTDSTVGLGCANRREDVLLVQFLLKSISRKTDPDAHEMFAVPGERPIAIDGICGPGTVAAIKRFQTFTIGDRNPNSPKIDGQIDISRPGHLITTRTNSVYTIIVLNVNFGYFNGSERHAALFREPEFPYELTDILFA
jgi:hypothetical protein